MTTADLDAWAELVCRVAVATEVRPDDLRAFEKQVTERLRSALLARPKVRLVETGKIERVESQAKRVIDNRPG